jgi:hypothetical protein
MGEVVCPYCKATVGGGSDVVCCLKCGTRHHRLCWLEYGNHCSVFSCKGNFPIFHKKTSLDIILIIWCFVNYGLHLSLRFIGEVTHPFAISDVWIVLAMELIVIATGWIVLRTRMASASVLTMSLLLFSGNALFVSLLLSHYITHGFEQLNALIRL